jgi:hypothetical protein
MPAQSAPNERPVIASALQAWLVHSLPLQCLDGSAHDGAFGEGKNWYDGRHAAYTLAHLLAAWVWRKDIHCDVEKLADSIRRCMAFILRRQNPDGRLDLLGMYSPNEAGFTIPGLGAGYERLESANELPDVRESLALYLRRAAGAVVEGTAYTANHRWAAACAPLAVINRLWPDSRYTDKIKGYLADGIDCDSDGCWYMERSPIYNNVANEAMLILTDYLGDPSFLDPVVRNLEFVLHCVQPNGEMDSSFSHRQDRGLDHCLPGSYLVARRIAQHTGDGRFTALANLCWRQAQGLPLNLLPLPLAVDRHPDPMPEEAALPVHYENLYAPIQVLRRRAGSTSLTLSADSSTSHFFVAVRDQWGGPRHSDDWFHLHWQDIVIQSIRLAGAGLSNMQPAHIECVEPDHYHLDGGIEGWVHPLHFRPGCPQVKMKWDWTYSADLTWTASGIDVHLQSHSPHSLAAVLKFLIRGPFQFEESGQPRTVQSGQEQWIGGGHLLIVRAGKSALRIEGLPACAHQLPIQHASSIPTQAGAICGTLNLGLTFPIDLRFKICLEHLDPETTLQNELV